MDKKDIEILKRNLRYGNYFKCLPIKWDSVNERIVVKSPWQQRHVIPMLVIHLLATLCRLYSITLHPSNIMHRAEAIFGALIYTIGLSIRLDIPVDHGAVQVLNFVMISIKPTTSKLILDVCLHQIKFQVC